MHRGTELVDSTAATRLRMFRLGDPLPVPLLGVWVRRLVARVAVGRRHRPGGVRSASLRPRANGAGSCSSASPPAGRSLGRRARPDRRAGADASRSTELVVGRSITYDVAANWKVIAENYNECYHCGPVHPELCDLVPSFRVRGGVGARLGAGHPAPTRGRHVHAHRHQQPGVVPRAQRGRAGQPLRRADLPQPDAVAVARPRRRVHPAPGRRRSHR